MNNWDIMSHHVRMGFAVPAGTKDASEHMLRFRVVLEALPGVKLKRGLWHVPLNAIDVVLAAADAHAMHVTAAAWSEDPKPPVTWAEAEAVLAAGGMRPEYLGAWPTPYQQEAVLFGWNLGTSTVATSGIRRARERPGAVLRSRFANPDRHSSSRAQPPRFSLPARSSAS
jgi:hypothetical protein